MIEFLMRRKVAVFPLTESLHTTEAMPKESTAFVAGHEFLMRLPSSVLHTFEIIITVIRSTE